MSNTPYSPHITRTQKLAIALILFALLAAIGMKAASGAEYTRDGGTADWQCCGDKTCSTIISQHADPVRAEKACARLTDADGVTRYTRSHAFRITKPGSPPVEPPACPAKPDDDKATGVCPAGSTGSWPQVQSYGSVPAPMCWVPSGFIPSSPPEGACTVTPPPTEALTAPTLATPTHKPGTNADRYDVTLTWSAVPGATSYRVRRCVGPNCSTMSIIQANVEGTTYSNTNIPANTFKYQVDARRGQSEIGPASNLVVYTVTAAPTPPPPPPDPPPTGTGTATLQWTPPTKNTDGTPVTLAGYRIRYSPVVGAGPSFSQTIDVRNAAATTYVVDGLAAGQWAFAVEAYNTQGITSLMSNAVTRLVP